MIACEKSRTFTAEAVHEMSECAQLHVLVHWTIEEVVVVEKLEAAQDLLLTGVTEKSDDLIG